MIVLHTRPRHTDTSTLERVPRCVRVCVSRFGVLKACIALSQYREAFLTIQDIHALIAQTRTRRPPVLAMYYDLASKARRRNRRVAVRRDNDQRRRGYRFSWPPTTICFTRTHAGAISRSCASTTRT